MSRPNLKDWLVKNLAQDQNLCDQEFGAWLVWIDLEFDLTSFGDLRTFGQEFNLRSDRKSWIWLNIICKFEWRYRFEWWNSKGNFFFKSIRHLVRGFHRYWSPSCFCLCALSGFHIAGFSNFACSALSGFHYSRILAFLPLVFTRSAGVSYFTRAIYVWPVLHLFSSSFFFGIIGIKRSKI
jgi:hypothetical protein